jgi:hypothetical protein
MEQLVTKNREGGRETHTWQCIEPDCNFVRKGNAQLDRVLKHATTCKYLQANNVDVWKAALEESGQGSLGAQIEGKSTVEPPVKRSRPSKMPQGKLDLDWLRQMGQKAEDEELRLYQARVDHVIMRLICVRGLVPNIVDSDEWKELMLILNSTYRPTSADTFANKHIPREAVFVCQKQIEILHTIDNLTLTFDGNTTRKPHSIYMAHATTPSRDTYFLDAHEGSDERHTTEWVMDKLLKVGT